MCIRDRFHYPLSDGDSLVDILRCFVIQRGLRAQGVPDLFQIGSGDPDPGLVQGMWLADVQSPLMDSLVDVGIAEHGGLVALSLIHISESCLDTPKNRV